MSPTKRATGFRRSLLVPVGALLIVLGACASVEPFDYTEVQDIQPGPGLFTGESGEWVIFGGDDGTLTD